MSAMDDSALTTGTETTPLLRARPPVVNKRRKTYGGRTSSNDEDIEESAAVLRLDLVLGKIERRLESYNREDFEGKLQQAYDALKAIFNDSASRVGEEARGRALVVVRLLEGKASVVLSAKDSVPERIHGARRFLEDALYDIENSYHRTVVEKISHLQQELRKGTLEAAQRVRAIRRAVAMASDRLLEYSELPYEWQNNPYIVKGYRFYESPVKCLVSVCQLHNETGNIWTHLAGFMFLGALALWAYPQTPAFSEMTFSDRMIFFVFVTAALKCLVCSALWHTFAHIANLDAMKRLACMDYVGISVLIAASIVTMEYHGFYCSPGYQAAYVGFTAALGLMGIVIPWFEWFDRVENRHYRIMFFLGIAISGALPVAHIMASQSVLRTLSFFAPVTKSIACYVVGVAIYASHWPERLSPGKFDSLGNSHQLWHLAILGGIYYHFRAVQQFHVSSRGFACGSCV
ncbi:inc metabolism membrane protein [Savitreella phatthalungensis]